nr:hypothetical protein [Shuttle vector pI3]
MTFHCAAAWSARSTRSQSRCAATHSRSALGVVGESAAVRPAATVARLPPVPPFVRSAAPFLGHLDSDMHRPAPSGAAPLPPVVPFVSRVGNCSPAVPLSRLPRPSTTPHIKISFFCWGRCFSASPLLLPKGQIVPVGRAAGGPPLRPHFWPARPACFRCPAARPLVSLLSCIVCAVTVLLSCI